MKSSLDEIGFYTMQENRVRNVSLKTAMKRCEMIIIEACNFSCPYCRGLSNEIYGNRSRKMLSLEEIKRNIDYWCEDLPLENIRFSGGEPTLHPDIVEVVAYAKSKGIKRIAISTNGSSSRNKYQQLIDAGANDFSISLDGCCAETVEKMSGGIKGAFDIISDNIRFLSSVTYVTVGVVLTVENVQQTLNTVYFADSLGVSDIRLISAAQWDKPVEALGNIPEEMLNKYPILKYRSENFINGNNKVRGMSDSDSSYCGLMWDDSVIAGDYHFPCVIYMREGGSPIGKVGPKMREARKEWADSHNTHDDPICMKNCLDTCKDYNNKFIEYHPDVNRSNRKRLPIVK